MADNENIYPLGWGHSQCHQASLWLPKTQLLIRALNTSHRRQFHAILH